MRTIKICVALLLVAALSQAAWGQAALQLKSRNQDNGSTYFVDPGTFTQWGVELNPDDIIAGNIVGAFGSKHPGAMNRPGTNDLEDTFGIVHMYFIKPGIVHPSQTYIEGVPGATAWDNSDGLEDTWFTSIFWGGNDVSVRFEVDPGASQGYEVTIRTDDVQFEIWRRDKAALAAEATAAGVGPIDPENLVSWNPASRTAFNRYEGWVDGSGDLMVTGVSTEFQFIGTLSGAAFGGQTETYFDVDENGPGLWDAAWGSTLGLLSLVDGVPSDAYFSWDMQGPSLRGWSVSSTDLGGVTVIPEPLTMLGVMLGVGSLGGYLRRRTRVG